MSKIIEAERPSKTSKLARNIGLGAAAAAEVTALVVFGPRALSKTLELGEVRGQRAALSDATADLAKSTKDLSFKPPATENVRGKTFNLASPPPNASDAAGTLRHAVDNLGKAGAPREVVEGVRDLADVTAANGELQTDFPNTKTKILERARALDIYADGLEFQQDQLEVSAAVNAALGVAPVVALGMFETTRRNLPGKRGNASGKISAQRPVASDPRSRIKRRT